AGSVWTSIAPRSANTAPTAIRIRLTMGVSIQSGVRQHCRDVWVLPGTTKVRQWMWAPRNISDVGSRRRSTVGPDRFGSDPAPFGSVLEDRGRGRARVHGGRGTEHLLPGCNTCDVGDIGGSQNRPAGDTGVGSHGGLPLVTADQRIFRAAGHLRGSGRLLRGSVDGVIVAVLTKSLVDRPVGRLGVVVLVDGQSRTFTLEVSGNP